MSIIIKHPLFLSIDEPNVVQDNNLSTQYLKNDVMLYLPRLQSYITYYISTQSAAQNINLAIFYHLKYHTLLRLVGKYATFITYN